MKIKNKNSFLTPQKSLSPANLSFRNRFLLRINQSFKSYLQDTFTTIVGIMIKNVVNSYLELVDNVRSTRSKRVLKYS